MSKAKTEKPTFKIVENGNLFELHKTYNGETQKLMVQANTTKKEFEKACVKFKE